MRDFLLVLGALAVMASSAKATEYDCKADQFRSFGSTFEMTTQFQFQLNQKSDGTSEITRLTGSMSEEGDYNTFNYKNVVQDTSYKPRKYVGSIRFELNSNSTTAYYSVFGYLIIEPNKNEKDQQIAHYVFQADGSGGTIDLVCETK